MACPMCGGIVEKRRLTTNGSYFKTDPTTQQRVTVQVCDECEYMNGLHEAQVTGKRKPRRKTGPVFAGFGTRIGPGQEAAAAARAKVFENSPLVLAANAYCERRLAIKTRALLKRGGHISIEWTGAIYHVVACDIYPPSHKLAGQTRRVGLAFYSTVEEALAAHPTGRLLPAKGEQ